MKLNVSAALLMLGVLMPTAHGKFIQSWVYETRAGTEISAIGDLNGDGAVDAIVSHMLMINDGTGKLNPASTASNGWGDENAEKVLLLKDFDGDGDLDILPDSNSEKNRLFLNDGTGVFSASLVEFDWSPRAYSPTAGDINGDGHLDLLVLVDLNRFNMVLLNDGSGGFLRNFDTAGKGGIVAKLADTNGDSHLDLLIAKSDGTNELRTNDGEGVFLLETEDIGGGLASDFGVSDLDGDADLDLFLAKTSGSNTILLNNGLGVFTNLNHDFGEETSSRVTLGDVDLDGDVDIFTTGAPGSLWLNNGAANFTEYTNAKLPYYAEDFQGDHFSGAPAIADFNGDGYPDLFPSVKEGIVDIFLGGGTPIAPTFITSVKFNLGYFSTLGGKSGDFDGDGDIDILLRGSAQGESQLRLMRNDGEGKFSDIESIFKIDREAGSASKLSVADFDGDTDLDLFFFIGSEAKILLNDGDAQFNENTESVLPEGGFPVAAVSVGDLSGDGIADLLVGGEIWLNDGSGSFTLAKVLTAGRIKSSAIFSANGDDKMDILGYVESNDDLIQWSNQGAGEFTAARLNFNEPVYEELDLNITDFDNDDKDDLIVYSFASTSLGTSIESLQFFLNNGTEKLRGPYLQKIDPTAASSRVHAVFDFDGDGDKDLWMLIFGQSFKRKVAINDGLGNFISFLVPQSANFRSYVDVVESIAADFNGNGREDLLELSGDGRHQIFSDVKLTLSKFTWSFGLSGAEAAAEADPDGDGVSNLEEWAYNMNPIKYDRSFLVPGGVEMGGLPVIWLENGVNGISINVESIELKDQSALSYALEISPSLSNFEIAPVHIEEEETINDFYQRKIRTHIPFTSVQKLFGRFHIKQFIE